MKEPTAMDRRHFLSQVGMITAATGAALSVATAEGETQTTTPAAAAAPLPTIALGKHQVTRLIVGSNPINGSSYLGPNLDRQMNEYFTIDHTVEFLLSCEAAGINTHQFSASASKKAASYIPQLRERGSRLQFLCLHSERKDIAQTIEKTRPLAMIHHGNTSDQLFAANKLDVIHDYVKAVHDQGLLAGVSTHNPDCVKRIADEGWEVDFFMTCLYFMSRRTARQDGERPSGLETVDTRAPSSRATRR